MDDLKRLHRLDGVHVHSWYVGVNHEGPTDIFASCSSREQLKELFEDMRKGGENLALLVVARSRLTHGG